MVAELGRPGAATMMAPPHQRIGERTSELSLEEENPRSTACENAVSSRRAALRVVTSVEQKEKLESKEQLEFQKICEGSFAFMDSDSAQMKHFGKLGNVGRRAEHH